jgi:predicted nucleic acid-binding protein
LPPLIENDVIFAYLNTFDSKFKVADRIFHKIKAGSLKVSISSVALVEMELIYRSERKEESLLGHMAALAAMPNTTFEPLTPDVVLSAIHLRETFHLGFFDSHYAATALSTDSTIISFDLAYDAVKGLRRIDPASA